MQLGILHTEGYAYIGGKGDIMVYNPKVELDDEYSTSRVALKTGPYNDFEAMEAGWQVSTKRDAHTKKEIKTRKHSVFFFLMLKLCTR